MQKLFIGALLVLSSVASAQNSMSCLQQASNRELLSEISARLGSSGGSSGNTTFVALCTGSYLYLRTFNMDTNAKIEKSFYFANGCKAHEDSLSRVSNQAVSRPMIVSICEGSYFKKISVSTSGSMTEVSNDYFANGCSQRAIEENNKL